MISNFNQRSYLAPIVHFPVFVTGRKHEHLQKPIKIYQNKFTTKQKNSFLCRETAICNKYSTIGHKIGKHAKQTNDVHFITTSTNFYYTAYP